MNRFISDSIRYIGVDDTGIKLFENQFALPDGMCYNSYLILDEKVAILDTTDARTAQLWKDRLHAELGGRTPDYLVVHHMEPDHAALIAETVAEYPEITVVASAKALAMIPLYFENFSAKTLAVKEGDVLELGSHSLHFIAAPMVHWPEVIMSYEPSEKVLFSADAFGKFGVYDADEGDWACEARRYYFNIVGKYGAPAKLVLEKAKKLDIKTVCALHGPILQGELLAEALRLYTIWTGYGVETEGVFVVYGSLHGNTAKAAEKLVEILQAKGCPKVACADLSEEDFHECIEDAFRYGRVIFAAPTYEGGVFPKMEQLLTHLAHKCWQGKKVGLVENGSWAPAAARTMREALERMKDITIVEPSVTIKGALKTSDISALEALADAILS